MADPQDGFERYYAEKIWELIPPIYRHEDGIAEAPGVLRALVEILATQAAVGRRSSDRVWEDAFAETADDWAIPYLADLLGTRLVSALNPRGRRVDVAKTIYYRRRKGTVRVLEELISDIAGWEGKVVESFQCLARSPHRLDAPPAARLGRFSDTPRGGTADLRSARGAAAQRGPFDEYAHTPDLRRTRGEDGVRNIPKVAFHLFRMRSIPMDGVAPFVRADGQSFTFDPSGRDVPLFMPRRRLDDWDEWRSALPWQLPAPMPCRLLGHAEFRVGLGLVADLVQAGLSVGAEAELRTVVGRRFRSEVALREHFDSFANAAELLAPATFATIREEALVEASGLHALYPGALRVEPVAGNPISREGVAAGNLDGWTATAPGKVVIVDPERGRFALSSPPPSSIEVRATYHYGAPGPLGAGGYDRRASLGPADLTVPIAGAAGGPIVAGNFSTDGVTEIADSATYGPVTNPAPFDRLIFQAANFERPYLRLASTLEFTSLGTDAELVLDGLWFGIAAPGSLVLRGSFRSVVLRHCTLDPGGRDTDGNPILPVPLRIEASIDELRVERSMTANILVEPSGSVDRLVVQDSVVDGDRSLGPSIDHPNDELHLDRSTVFGVVDVERLWASEAIVTGTVDVTNTQDGCFRFSAAPPASRLPRPYEAHWLQSSASLFVSRRFGDPGYAQLSEAAPSSILRGAEDTSEMGAFSSLRTPIRMDGLRAKVDEYLPFGLIPAFIVET
ncbi:MAG: hypothetical protein AAGF12_37390 [Myxococcota bacterium]